jgi:hypothetical protein
MESKLKSKTFKGRAYRCESGKPHLLSSLLCFVSDPPPLYYYDKAQQKAAPLPNGQPRR